MHTNTNIMNERAIISLEGRFDFSANHVFMQSYEPALQSNEITEIEIDMDAVQYLDSSALGMLLLLKERTDQVRKSLVVSNCHGTVRQILEIANFLTLFKVR